MLRAWHRIPHKYFAQLAIAWSLAIATPAALAHDFALGDAVVGHPWAEPAKKGGDTRLFAYVQNDEQRNLHILGLTTPVARHAELHFRLEGERIGTLKSRSIRADEALNIASDHMWFDLHDLNRDLREGEIFPATLLFADGGRLALKVLVSKRGHDPVLFEFNGDTQQSGHPAAGRKTNK